MALETRKESFSAGVKDSHIAFITSEDATGAKYDATVITTPNIKTLTITKEGEATKVTASNTVYDVVSANEGVTVTYNVLALDVETQAKILGRKFEKAGDVIVSAIVEDAVPMEFGFTTESPTNDGKVVFLSLPKLKSSGEIEETYQDMGSGFEEPAKEFSFESLTTAANSEYYIHTSPISKEDAAKIRAVWHAKPVQSVSEAVELINTALTTTGEA